MKKGLPGNPVSLYYSVFSTNFLDKSFLKLVLEKKKNAKPQICPCYCLFISNENNLRKGSLELKAYFLIFLKNLVQQKFCKLISLLPDQP